MEIGDVVTRKSYGNDISFIIQDIQSEQATLVGLEYRLIADAQLSDLEALATRSPNGIENLKDVLKKSHKKQDKKEQNLEYTEESSLMGGICYGKVLHIDANLFYLEQSLRQYKKLGVPVIGVSIEESNQPAAILELLRKNKPNIVVITGHDALDKEHHDSTDINHYLNSKYYVEAVKIARDYKNAYDELVIIAGGCKSYYEGLMQAGANFASSPSRILINITDPVYVACKLATTSFKQILDMDTVAKDIFTSLGGIGGIETRGQSRAVKPKF